MERTDLEQITFWEFHNDILNTNSCMLVLGEEVLLFSYESSEYVFIEIISFMIYKMQLTVVM